MAYLEIRGQRHPIGIGEMAIGCDAANEVEFGGGELHSKSAILQGMPDGQVVVKRADADSEVQINGIRLGPQPTPLLHGDKIEVAGQELLFVDDRRSGSTEYIKAVDPSMLGGSSKSKGKGGATAGTGGRLVSLTDGREYEITGGSVLIGRDASCDIVISAKNVSRRHAEVVATPRGYVLIDNSTNGTLVNGERVQGQHVLSRADVFRCGDHEFRFYADAAEVADSAPAGAGAEYGSASAAAKSAICPICTTANACKGSRTAAGSYDARDSRNAASRAAAEKASAAAGEAHAAADSTAGLVRRVTTGSGSGTGTGTGKRGRTAVAAHDAWNPGDAASRAAAEGSNSANHTSSGRVDAATGSSRETPYFGRPDEPCVALGAVWGTQGASGPCKGANREHRAGGIQRYRITGR